MYKLMVFVRRRAGMTHEEFKVYYDNIHSKMGDEYLPPYCKKYLRHYITPAPHQMKLDRPPHPEFDCVVELWFDSEADCHKFESSVTDPELVKAIVADEEAFMDRRYTFRYVMEDSLSWGPPDPGKVLAKRA
jgi:hypothetical protein